MRGSFKWIPMVVSLVGVAVVFWSASKLVPAQSAVFEATRLEGTVNPDVNGIWQALNTANWNIEPHAARAGLATVEGPTGEVPAAAVLALGAIAAVPGGAGIVDGGEIPYQAWALEQRQENRENVLTRDPEVKCFMPGVPRATYMPYPFQIVQSTNKVLVVYEFASASRTIHLDTVGRAPVNAWMGQSVGRWEGDTLVVEVTDQVEDTWFDRAGNFHSDELKVTERYTPMTPDHLQYEAVIEDPNVFTRPWTISMPLYRHKEANAQLTEFKCVEFVEELVYGHLRKEQLVRRWEGDFGQLGQRLIIDVTRTLPVELR